MMSQITTGYGILTPREFTVHAYNVTDNVLHVFSCYIAGQAALAPTAIRYVIKAETFTTAV